jgi:hypothetical protein
MSPTQMGFLAKYRVRMKMSLMFPQTRIPTTMKTLRLSGKNLSQMTRPTDLNQSRRMPRVLRTSV